MKLISNFPLTTCVLGYTCSCTEKIAVISCHNWYQHSLYCSWSDHPKLQVVGFKIRCSPLPVPKYRFGFLIVFSQKSWHDKPPVYGDWCVRCTEYCVEKPLIHWMLYWEAASSNIYIFLAPSSDYFEIGRATLAGSSAAIFNFMICR